MLKKKPFRVRLTSTTIRKIIRFLRYKEFLHSVVYLKTQTLRDLIVLSKFIDVSKKKLMSKDKNYIQYT